MNMTRCVSDPAEREEFELAWQAAGVTCIFQNAGEECQEPLRLLKRLARFTYVTDMLRDFVGRAVTPDDVLTAKKAGKRCLYLTGNGIPLTGHWVSVEDELRQVPVFFQLGIRMMHLTYHRRNMLGDGCGELANGGLSDFGRQAIAALEPGRRDRGRGPLGLADEPGSGQVQHKAGRGQSHGCRRTAQAHPRQAR